MGDDNVSGTSDEGWEWNTKELELLYDAIQDELQVYNGIGDYGLAEEVIRTLAWAVPSAPMNDCACGAAGES